MRTDVGRPGAEKRGGPVGSRAEPTGPRRVRRPADAHASVASLPPMGVDKHADPNSFDCETPSALRRATNDFRYPRVQQSFDDCAGARLSCGNCGALVPIGGSRRRSAFDGARRADRLRRGAHRRRFPGGAQQICDVANRRVPQPPRQCREAVMRRPPHSDTARRSTDQPPDGDVDRGPFWHHAECRLSRLAATTAKFPTLLIWPVRVVS
jgi:hypothetical protein